VPNRIREHDEVTTRVEGLTGAEKLTGELLVQQTGC
jgi:hypothetical protein